MNETLKVLKERRSVRKYKAEQIRDEELNAILEAGTWAPSANVPRPWCCATPPTPAAGSSPGRSC